MIKLARKMEGSTLPGTLSQTMSDMELIAVDYFLWSLSGMQGVKVATLAKKIMGPSPLKAEPGTTASRIVVALKFLLAIYRFGREMAS